MNNLIKITLLLMFVMSTGCSAKQMYDADKVFGTIGEKTTITVPKGQDSKSWFNGFLYKTLSTNEYISINRESSSCSKVKAHQYYELMKTVDAGKGNTLDFYGSEASDKRYCQEIDIGAVLTILKGKIETEQPTWVSKYKVEDEIRTAAAKVETKRVEDAEAKRIADAEAVYNKPENIAKRNTELNLLNSTCKKMIDSLENTYDAKVYTKGYSRFENGVHTAFKTHNQVTCIFTMVIQRNGYEEPAQVKASQILGNKNFSYSDVF